MVTLWSVSSAVAVVKVTVTALPVRPGILSAAAMAMPTFETVPPRATVGPDAGLSVEVETVTPAVEAAMGPPIVAPVRVMVRAPEATGTTDITMYVNALLLYISTVSVAAPAVPRMRKQVLARNTKRNITQPRAHMQHTHTRARATVAATAPLNPQQLTA